MAKLHIFYKSSENKMIIHNLKVEVDGKEYEIEKNKILEVELEKGAHEIKLYAPYELVGAGGTFGQATETIQMQDEDLFYYFQLPVMYSQKGKFVKVNNAEGLEKMQKRSAVKSKISTVVAIIIVLLIVAAIIWSLMLEIER
jgi:hypothetical protein